MQTNYTKTFFNSNVLPAISPIDTNTEINYAELKKAVGEYFPAGYGVDEHKFNILSGRFYESISLGERGDIWGFLDRTALEIALPAATAEIRGHSSSSCPPTHRLLIVGCGDGRLCEALIVSALKLGYIEITFNDLFAFHIEKVKDRVARLNFDRESIKISYNVGDFANARFEGYYDVAVAMFFVTAEILSLTSLKTLNEKRSSFFRAIKNALHPFGVFVEDTPEMTWPGFYNELRIASAKAMSNVHGLGKEANNFTLTALNKPNGGLPYHVRYMPERSRHFEERLANGFRPLDNWTIPASTDSARLERWKRIALWGM